MTVISDLMDRREARFQVAVYDGGQRRVIATRATRAEAADVMWPIAMAQGAADMKIEPVLLVTNLMPPT